MKNTIAFVLSIALIISIAFNTVVSSASIARDVEKVYIFGTTSMPNQHITLMILKEGKTLADMKNNNIENVLYLDQSKSDENGKYSFTVSRNGIENGRQYIVCQNEYASKIIRVSKVSDDDSIENKKALNVVEFGADNTGEEDSTAVLEILHSTGKMIYYPAGTYRFNGENLDLSGGVVFEDFEQVKLINNISDENILNFDDAGHLIGLQQNHLEKADINGCSAMTIGNIIAPPLSNASYETRADIIPYWYNDFGLEKTRLAAGAAGWTGWYYWAWNFHNPMETNMVYDPSRHPLLGFYKGDEPNILDWQCFWLKEYGVKAVTLMTSVGTEPVTSGWQQPASGNYWIYKLFNNVPNFNNLGYVLSLSTDFGAVNEAQLNAIWDDAIDNIIGKHGNVYCVEKNGKKYPAVFLFEEGAVHGVFNYSTSEYINFCASKAEKLKGYGYDGLAILARNPDNDNMSDYNSDFENRDVIRYVVDYEPQSTGDTYSDMVNNFTPKENTYNIQNTFTSATSQYPHPTNWNHPGNTPELFAKLINKQVEYLENNISMPKIITCYNISEWAEGGASLQPNIKDRFGYLEAVKDAVVVNPKIDINVTYFDEDNIPVRSLITTGPLTQHINIYDTDYEGDTVYIITAFYKDNRLIKAVPCRVKLTDKKSTIKNQLSVEDLKDCNMIKVMAMDSFDRMQPPAMQQILK